MSEERSNSVIDRVAELKRKLIDLKYKADEAELEFRLVKTTLLDEIDPLRKSRRDRVVREIEDAYRVEEQLVAIAQPSAAEQDLLVKAKAKIVGLEKKYASLI